MCACGGLRSQLGILLFGDHGRLVACGAGGSTRRGSMCKKPENTIVEIWIDLQSLPPCLLSMYLLTRLLCHLESLDLETRPSHPIAIGHRPSPSASMHQPSPHHALAKRHRLRTAHTSDTSVSHWPHSRTGTSLSSSSTHSTHTYPRTRYPSGPLAPPAPPRAASSSTLCGHPTLLSPATASCRGM